MVNQVSTGAGTGRTGRLMELAGERVHARTMEMSTFEVDGTHILCSGHFLDVRHSDSVSLLGQRFKAGPLHDLEVHVLVKLPELVIEDLEVAINAVPMADCRSLEHSLDAVIGHSIARGFTGTVKSLAGGKAGCTHLVHLLTTMAPAILQGYWAWLDAERPEAATASDGRASGRIASGRVASGRSASSVRFLRNSCHSWRADGAAFRALLDLAGEEAPGGGAGD